MRSLKFDQARRKPKCARSLLLRRSLTSPENEGTERSRARISRMPRPPFARRTKRSLPLLLSADAVDMSGKYRRTELMFKIGESDGGATLTDSPRRSEAERKLPRRTTSRNIRMPSQSGVEPTAVNSAFHRQNTPLRQWLHTTPPAPGLVFAEYVGGHNSGDCPMTAHDRNFLLPPALSRAGPRTARHLADVDTQKLARRLGRLHAQWRGDRCAR